MSSGLVVALDFDSEREALSFADKLSPAECALKVGSELFTSTGSGLVQSLVARQFRVFLDLKWHDIPNTVARACKAAADLGVWMVNVHAAGGFPMMSAARQALSGPDAPLLVAVTVLTSLDNDTLHATGCPETVEAQVLRLATLAADAGLDGVVCSPHEVSAVKAAVGKPFIAVTPGVRIAEDARDDQVRIMTPEAAIAAGSDYLVMGRSITRATSPETLVKQYALLTRQHPE